MGLNFVAVDLGLANDGSGSVCAVGMVRVRDGVISDRETLLVKPDEAIDSFAPPLEQNRVTAEDVADAPSWAEALPSVMRFVQDDFVVVHDHHFTADELKKAADAAGVDQPDLSVFSTLDLVTNAVPTLKNPNLISIAKALKLGEVDVHDAGRVAEVTAMTCTRLASHAGVESLTALMKGYKVPVSVIGRGREFASESSLLQKAPVSAPETTVIDTVGAESPLSRRERRALDQKRAGGRGDEEAQTPPVESVQATKASKRKEVAAPSAKSASAAPAASDDTPAGQHLASNDSKIVFLLPVVPLLIAVGLWFMNMQDFALMFAIAFVISIPAVAGIYFWGKKNAGSPKAASKDIAASAEDKAEAPEKPARVASPVVEAKPTPAVSDWTGQIIQARHVLERTEELSPRGRRARQAAKEGNVVANREMAS